MTHLANPLLPHHGKILPALSVCQPWAHLIFHAGKSIENRKWKTSYRGPLLIHASRSATYKKLCGGPLQIPNANAWTHVPPWPDLTRGSFVGLCDLIDCVPFEQVKEKPFAEGPYCLVLDNIRPFFGDQAAGRLGFFPVQIDHEGRQTVLPGIFTPAKGKP